MAALLDFFDAEIDRVVERRRATGLDQHQATEHLEGSSLADGVDGPELARRALLEQRLIVNATGPRTIRLEPPLIVSEDEIDDAVARLEELA